MVKLKKGMEERKEILVLRCSKCKATITMYGDKNKPLPDYAQTGCEKCGGAMYGEKEKLKV